MCGIWTLISNNKEKLSQEMKDIQKKYESISGRGPECKTLLPINEHILFGFHRLCIVDVSDAGNQPFVFKNQDREIYLICNGEIYNHKSLTKEFDLVPNSNSDCEPILHLYMKLGLEKTIEKLDGVFAISILDIDKLNGTGKLMVARDRIGVRPVFMGYTDNKQYGFSSEAKGLTDIFENVEVFTPGTLVTLSFDLEHYNFKFMKQVYYPFDYDTKLNDQSTVESLIRYQFIDSVKKRMMSDRPMCSLLSGGLDSSLVSAILAQESKDPIHTFSIGMPGGTDFKYAKMVADKIGSVHKEIIFSPEEGLNAIRDVIWATETFDITTVRASVGQYLISKYIKENTDFKVVYIGDGSDELTAGYKYFCNAPNEDELHKECVKLIKEIHLYDALRADRAVSIHGLETRVPFLDSSFVDLYLSIDPKLRVAKDGVEKYLLRKAFDSTDLLPKEVLWREKEAFSDGVSTQKDSWYTIIQRHIDTKVTEEEFEMESSKYTHCKPLTKEAYYYRRIFDELFGEKYSNVIPHFWLPKWCGDIKEPSARVLNVYKSKQSENVALNDV
ncbi:Asparagine synthase [seawater metagenome]|uniref:asparagine synthase (glutamine-hydrolyzing) n=1 Tax=seawater metagenome TaxID=1561972 RepID=A0A5E8CLQ5_9ZZZZ